MCTVTYVQLAAWPTCRANRAINTRLQFRPAAPVRKDDARLHFQSLCWSNARSNPRLQEVAVPPMKNIYVDYSAPEPLRIALLYSTVVRDVSKIIEVIKIITKTMSLMMLMCLGAFQELRSCAWPFPAVSG